MLRNKWESFDADQKEAREEDRIATQYAREFLKEQSVDAAVFTQKAADILRQLEQIRGTLAAAHARQEQKKANAPAISTQEVIASLVPFDVTSQKTTASCAA